MRGLPVGTAPMAIALVLWLGGQGPDPRSPTADLRFTNIARDAGLDMTTVFGGREKNTYLVETTGTGVAMLVGSPGTELEFAL